MSSLRLLISVSEPWELGEATKWQSLRGELMQMADNERGGQALIKLDYAINYHGSIWRYLVAAPRLQGDEIAMLQAGKKIPCAFIGISDQQAESNVPPDRNEWRGGLAFIGDIEQF